ncbi:hypothetical protein GW17_00052739 [Ensete ventricosum]|nr:hypothetical protein GW17_00052739 [Ensete ventricosum]
MLSCMSTILCGISMIQRSQKFFMETGGADDTRKILVSCFVKTSHFEEYLCVKIPIMYEEAVLSGWQAFEENMTIRKEDRDNC